MADGWEIDQNNSSSKSLDEEESSSITKGEELEILISKCLKALQDAQQRNFNPDRAQEKAALTVEIELKLIDFISDAELRAKHLKNEIDRIEADKYLAHKRATAAKLTEGALEKMIASDPDVIAAKRSCAEAEVEARKWNNFLNSMKDAHYFFKSLIKLNA